MERVTNVDRALLRAFLVRSMVEHGDQGVFTASALPGHLLRKAVNNQLAEVLPKHPTHQAVSREF